MVIIDEMHEHGSQSPFKTSATVCTKPALDTSINGIVYQLHNIRFTSGYPSVTAEMKSSPFSVDYTLTVRS